MTWAAGVLVQAAEEPAGDSRGVLVGAAGQGETADQHVQAGRGRCVAAKK